MSLDRIGINSLSAVNQWIGVINGNLQSAGRTGYKTTRANFTDGLGLNTVAGNLEIPPSTLTVQSTKVEWGQGSVVNSDVDTHFALQGDGFFTLHDEASNKYYVSRDGEFHWSNEGYLVNSAGLKVVSAGRDYIRYAPGDLSDVFHKDGYSADLAKYGDKNFLLLDFANRDNLRMSQYGSTVFELDGSLTTRVTNDFSTSMDGLTFIYDDPANISVIDDPGFTFVANPPLIPDTIATINFGDNASLDITITPTITIDDILTQINGHLPGSVSAGFDEGSDTVFIENVVATGGNNRISFSGVNGQALARFFNLDYPRTQEFSVGAQDSFFIQSGEDIDNSQFNSFKDIDSAPSPLYVGESTRSQHIFDLINPEPTYSHNKQNAYVEADARAAVFPAGAPGVRLPTSGSMAISEASATDEFDVVMDIKFSNDDPGLVIFSLGQSDAHSRNSGGYDLIYNSHSANANILDGNGNPLAPGAVMLREKPRSYGFGDLPVSVGPQQVIGQFGSASANLDTDPTVRMVVQLNGNGELTFGLNSSTASFNLLGSGESISGYLNLRNTGNVLRTYSSHADFKSSTNTQTTGPMVSVGQSDIANYESATGVHGNRPRTYVSQNALEASEASLTEYLPMLSIAQKVFTSISKIISTHNLITDDLNTLVR